MVQRTASDVASMELEVQDLRSKVKQLEEQLVMLKSERLVYKTMNTTLRRRAEDHLEKATRLETIMKQVTAGLVAGLNEMQAERETELAARPPTIAEAAAMRDAESDHLSREHVAHGSAAPSLRTIVPVNEFSRAPANSVVEPNTDSEEDLRLIANNMLGRSR